MRRLAVLAAVLVVLLLPVAPAYANHCPPAGTSWMHYDYHWYKTGAGTTANHYGFHYFKCDSSLNHLNVWHTSSFHT